MNKVDLTSHNWLAQRINNRALEKHLKPIYGRVIDLGCGTAPYKKALLTVADEYIGVDWMNSPHDISNVDVFADLSMRFPFAGSYADAIVSFQVMEHLPEPAFFLWECYRVLRSSGTLLITVPFMWHVHEAPNDYFRYTRYGLEYLLRQCGFVEIEIQENTGFWQMWVLKFNYHTARFAKGILRWFWVPIWYLGQIVSPVLDRYDQQPQETGSYTALARKP